MCLHLGDYCTSAGCLRRMYMCVCVCVCVCVCLGRMYICVCVCVCVSQVEVLAEGDQVHDLHILLAGSMEQLRSTGMWLGLTRASSMSRASMTNGKDRVSIQTHAQTHIHIHAQTHTSRPSMTNGKDRVSVRLHCTVIERSSVGSCGLNGQGECSSTHAAHDTHTITDTHTGLFHVPTFYDIWKG